MIRYSDPVKSALRSGGYDLYGRAERLGELRSSAEVRTDFEELRRRMETDGYLYIPGFFPRSDVLQVRKSLLEKLAEDGVLDERFPVMEGISSGSPTYFRSDIANSNEELRSFVYSPLILDFYSALLGGPAAHYDYTWLRTVSPGQFTSPHCDIVYMGRGTSNLFTAWIPYGDVTPEIGGLMVLEGSHRDRERLGDYTKMDVDTACLNANGQSELNAAGFHGFGVLTFDPNEIAERLDRRWLTANFQMGDLLTFSVFTIHASLDNQSNRLRLSSDTRYQLASEPMDERWIGENPPAHGGKMVREMIC